jgi:hypothetical protein
VSPVKYEQGFYITEDGVLYVLTVWATKDRSSWRGNNVTAVLMGTASFPRQSHCKRDESHRVLSVFPDLYWLLQAAGVATHTFTSL